MDPLHLLKQLKNIKADPAYVKHSRARLFNSNRSYYEPEFVTLPTSPWRMMLRAMESGFAIVLTGALLLLVAGGFSGLRKPVGLAGLDPAGLKAEAEAVDIQIQLSDLDYQGVMNAEEPKIESNLSWVVKKASRAIGVLDEPEFSEPVVTNSAIDEALDALVE